MSRRGWAILGLFFVVIMWTFPPLVAKYVYQEAPAVDAWTQNFARYFSAAVTMLILAAVRRNGLGRDRPHRVRLLLPAIPNVIQQSLWVLALYSRNFFPGQTALLSKLVAVFGAVYAYIFFPEERSEIRSPRFLIGISAALIGAAGLILTDKNRGDAAYLQGATLTIFSMAAWGFYGVAMKKASRDTDPLTAFTLVSLYSAASHGILALLLGDVRSLFGAPPMVLIVLCASGILCMSIAHPIYFFAVKELGLAVCVVALLLMAITTPLLSMLQFGETFTPIQIVFAAVLLLGTVATIRKGRANISVPQR